MDRRFSAVCDSLSDSRVRMRIRRRLPCAREQYWPTGTLRYHCCNRCRCRRGNSNTTLQQTNQSPIVRKVHLENLPLFFSTGQSFAGYGLGRRVEAKEGSSTTFYAYEGTDTLAEIVPGAPSPDYVYANGIRIARTGGRSAQPTTLQTRLEAHAWLRIQVAELSSRTTTSPLEATTPQKAARPTSLRANLTVPQQSLGFIVVICPCRDCRSLCSSRPQVQLLA